MDISDDELDATLADLRAIGSWSRAPYDGTRRSLAAIKNLTSDLIGRFCGSVQAATFAAGDGPWVRHGADLVVPRETLVEISLLKGIAAHYVMQADDRVALMARQRELVAELFEVMLARGADGLDRAFAEDYARAGDDDARVRVVVDQIASLTDASALTRHAQLTS